jgi:NAD(P)H-nitrite reductase large subunit
MDPRKKKREEIICLCNSVTKAQIEDAISMGCESVDAIGDKTSAGMGQCGGSCRPDLERMLAHYKNTGEFLPKIKIKR